MSALSEEYGYDNALSELTEKSTTIIDGDSYYRLQQNYQGIPVYGRTVVCATDKNGNVTSLTGNIEDVSEDTLLVPSTSWEEIIASISLYIKNELGINLEEDIVEISLAEAPLYIYNLSPETEVHLVYKVNWSTYEFLVDAHTATVVKFHTTIYSDMVEFSINGYKLDLNKNKDNEGQTYYTMVDDLRHIRIYNANDGALSYEFYDSNGELVIDRNGQQRGEWVPEDLAVTLVSTTNIEQPISDQIAPIFDEKAIRLLAELQATYDFYKDVLLLEGVSVDGSLVWIDGVYNDNMKFVNMEAYIMHIVGNILSTLWRTWCFLLVRKTILNLKRWHTSIHMQLKVKEAI